MQGAERDCKGVLGWLYRRGAWCRLVDAARQRVASIWLVLGSQCGFWARVPPSPIYILSLNHISTLLLYAHLLLSDPEPEASKMSLEVSKMPEEAFVPPS